MHECAREILRKLLDKADVGGAPVLHIKKQGPCYRAHSSVEEREAIHATLQNAVEFGAIHPPRFGRHAACQDLEKIELRDADRLAAFLGVGRLAEKLQRMEQAIRPLLAGGADWLDDAFSGAVAQWRRGRNWESLPVESAAQAAQLFRVLRAVAAGEHAALDLRSFSARLLGNSKAIEGMIGPFCRVWRRYHPDAALLEDVALCEELGLLKFPQPAFLAGPLRLRYAGEPLRLAHLRPYVALSPDAVEPIEAQGARYLLTIENMASFQRYVREVDDGGLILYSNGFPSPDFRGLLQRLSRVLPPELPAFHWGDLDVGGLTILKRIQACMPERPLRAHLMEPATGPSERLSPFSGEEISRLQRLAEGEGEAARLATAVLAAQPPGKREQELLAPRSPLARP